MGAVLRLPIVVDGESLPPPEAYARPRERGDCLEGGVNEARPCPWATCKFHLYTDATIELRRKIATDGLEIMTDTCALDVADRGGSTLGDLAEAFGATRELVRQREAKAYKHVYALLGRGQKDAKALSDFAPDDVEAQPTKAERRGVLDVGQSRHLEPAPPEREAEDEGGDDGGVSARHFLGDASDAAVTEWIWRMYERATSSKARIGRGECYEVSGRWLTPQQYRMLHAIGRVAAREGRPAVVSELVSEAEVVATTAHMQNVSGRSLVLWLVEAGLCTYEPVDGLPGKNRLGVALAEGVTLEGLPPPPKADREIVARRVPGVAAPVIPEGQLSYRDWTLVMRSTLQAIEASGEKGLTLGELVRQRWAKGEGRAWHARQMFEALRVRGLVTLEESDSLLMPTSTVTVLSGRPAAARVDGGRAGTKSLGGGVGRKEERTMAGKNVQLTHQVTQVYRVLLEAMRRGKDRWTSEELAEEAGLGGDPSGGVRRASACLKDAGLLAWHVEGRDLRCIERVHEAVVEVTYSRGRSGIGVQCVLDFTKGRLPDVPPPRKAGEPGETDLEAAPSASELKAAARAKAREAREKTPKGRTAREPKPDTRSILERTGLERVGLIVEKFDPKAVLARAKAVRDEALQELRVRRVGIQLELQTLGHELTDINEAIFELSGEEAVDADPEPESVMCSEPAQAVNGSASIPTAPPGDFSHRMA